MGRSRRRVEDISDYAVWPKTKPPCLRELNEDGPLRTQEAISEQRQDTYLLAYAATSRALAVVDGVNSCDPCQEVQAVNGR